MIEKDAESSLLGARAALSRAWKRAAVLEPALPAHVQERSFLEQRALSELDRVRAPASPKYTRETAATGTMHSARHSRW
jgi:hypothetical protein